MYLDITEQLKRERARSSKLADAVAQRAAEIEYISMMTGIEIPVMAVEGGENNDEKPEV